MEGLRQLQIPTIGDALVLAKPWTFTLHDEYRNLGFFKFIGAVVKTEYKWSDITGRSYSWTRAKASARLMKVTIPAGAELRVDRIYLRKGKSDYDSITFLWKTQLPAEGKKKPKPKTVRFWSKLHDVNTMVVRSSAWSERDDQALTAAESITRSIELE